MAGRPILITIIALITILEGILTVVSGALVSFSSSNGFVQDVFSAISLEYLINEVSSWLGASLIIVGIIILVVGLGLLLGWKFAWYVAALIYFITLILALYSVAVSLATGEYIAVAALIPAIIAIVLVYYIFRPKVKEFYGL
ncbi:MAG: hypothetical protein LBS92_04560 [Candidatus Methanoplasma sp.]|jgi:hypothetical protein|nr:hypothetical protein [Candidatus Methanoplasma sp.]